MTTKTNEIVNTVSVSILLVWLVVYFVVKLKYPDLDQSWTIATMIVAPCVCIFLLIGLNVDF